MYIYLASSMILYIHILLLGEFIRKYVKQKRLGKIALLFEILPNTGNAGKMGQGIRAIVSA